MARIKLTLPSNTLFETQLSVRVSDINYGKHLANDAVLRLAHEARVRFFQSLGYHDELSIEGTGIVVADAVVCYRAEAFHGDVLRFTLSADDFNSYGFDLFYQLTDNHSNKEVARLKTGIVFFDYTERKLAQMPAAFRHKLDK